MILTIINQHPFILLCCVIWIVSGIVATTVKKDDSLAIAAGVTILIGIGWLISRGYMK